MKCKLCKLKEATYHKKNFHICDGCLIEIQLSVQYYIGGKEVSSEEYYRRLHAK